MKEELEKLLEDLHEKLLIGWIKNDGKTHVIPSHAHKDGCINDTLTSIINLVDKEVIGEDYPKDYPYDDPEAIKYFNIEKERQRAKLKGDSNG